VRPCNKSFFLFPNDNLNAQVLKVDIYIEINTWAFPYWPGYHPETPILARDGVEGQYGPRDDNQANMEMSMY
jgi:hypothetical protein